MKHTQPTGCGLCGTRRQTAKQLGVFGAQLCVKSEEYLHCIAADTATVIIVHTSQ